MKLLLDTHTFIWWTLEPEKLPKLVLTSLENPDNSSLFRHEGWIHERLRLSTIRHLSKCLNGMVLSSGDEEEIISSWLSQVFPVLW